VKNSWAGRKTDIMVVNSYILIQEFRKSHDNLFTNVSSAFGQLEFSESLAISLMGLNEKCSSKDVCLNF
jgi:hypothetical protein